VSEPVNLAYLCHHYGEAYEINMRRRRYEARRRDDGTVLTADSADALLDLIRADYSARPVLRHVTGDDPPETPSCRLLPGGNGVRGKPPSPGSRVRSRLGGRTASGSAARSGPPSVAPTTSPALGEDTQAGKWDGVAALVTGRVAGLTGERKRKAIESAGRLIAAQPG